MTPAALILYVLLAVWIGGGSLWLLTRRRYALHQTPRFAMDLLGFPVELAQSVFGRGAVPYALLLPNMLIFGIFTFAPMILNFWVSLTGGESIALTNRPYVGLAHYANIFDCQSILRPNSCSNAGLTFWTAMGNTLKFVVIQVPVLVGAALLTALVLNRNIRGRGFWRAMFFYPVMLSPVVIANIWRWTLHRKGMLNEALASSSEAVTAAAGRTGFDLVVTVVMAILLLLSAERTLRAGRDPSLLWASVLALLFLATISWANPAAMILAEPGLLSPGLGIALAAGLLWLTAAAHPRTTLAVVALCIASVFLLLLVQFDAVFDLGPVRPVNWLVAPNTGWPFFWLVFVFCWAHMGFYMLILLAGLQAIPADLYEAAKMDASRPVRVFFRITLPLLMPTLTVVVILALIRSFQVFDEVYLLTGGGPGRETFMVVQNIFEQAFTGNHPDFGEAAAGSVMMAVVIAVFAFSQLYATRRQSDL